MSGNSRRGFLRELAAAAAKAGAQRTPQPPSVEPEPPLPYAPPEPPLDPSELLSDTSPYMPPAVPLDPPDAGDDGLGLTAIELARYERQLVLPEWSGAAQL